MFFHYLYSNIKKMVNKNKTSICFFFHLLWLMYVENPFTKIDGLVINGPYKTRVIGPFKSEKENIYIFRHRKFSSLNSRCLSPSISAAASSSPPSPLSPNLSSINRFFSKPYICVCVFYHLVICVCLFVCVWLFSF